MRAIMESGFYLIYLVFIMGLGIYLLIKSKEKRFFIYFGLAAFILGFGDAFHLVPRAVGLFSKTLDNPSETLAMFLGVGKLVTSITMTVFYGLAYIFIYKRVNKQRNKILDIVVLVLIVSRFALCAFPQNGWITNDSNILWGVLRNIPFVILGSIVIALFFMHFKEIKYLKWMGLATILSFGFYIPVVLFASTAKWVGMLMLPKTICYMWIGILELLDFKTNKKTD